MSAVEVRGQTPTVIRSSLRKVEVQTVRNVTINTADAGGYEHTQASPSALWTVNHNLGRKPLIQVLTVGGVLVSAEVNHITVNQAQVVLNTAIAGTALAR